MDHRSNETEQDPCSKPTGNPARNMTSNDWISLARLHQGANLRDH
jgi:hypothetical protein